MGNNRKTNKRAKEEDEDKQTKHTDTKGSKDTGNDKKNNKKKKKKGSTWKGMWTKTKMLWPFMWPRGNFLLQLRIVVSMLILLAARGVSVLIPILYKEIVNSMTVQPVETNGLSRENNGEENDTDTATKATFATTVTIQGIEFRWDLVVMYILVKTLHGGTGYLNCLRAFLWIRVSQNTRKKMILKLFSHLHGLSVRWHLGRKTGEVLKVMDRGVMSINLVLSQIMFNIAPVFVDIVIAVCFFVAMFNVWTGLIVCGTMVLYLVSTVVMNEWRTKYRRKMNEADNKKNAASVDSILNFETVKYYTAEDWEVQRYSDAVDKHQKTEFVVSATMNLLNAIQKTVMMIGLLAGSLLTAWYVYDGRLTVGDYVLFAAYIEQLYGPLTNFGTFYRVLQTSFVDMENMLDMMKETIEIRDVKDAPPLDVGKGSIEFKDVCFAYNERKPVLKNISFCVPAGKTYALVGDSGGGKSTVTRLLLRFYDIQSGTILIDGQDISKVTQKSLRRQIGVVPQDTTLFNSCLRFNIRYGRVDATDEEIEEAAKAADIHDRILSFPDGYDSRVGERGLKLSGGEKQRVAIARTILKGPEIVLLDEATSALDTKTERNIQASLARLCQNKTTIVVAHRLSTIINSDQILVIKNGEIIETGTHDDLLELDGIYADMWREQLEKAEAEDDQSTLDKAGTSDDSNKNTVPVDSHRPPPELPGTGSGDGDKEPLLDKDTASQNPNLKDDSPASNQAARRDSVTLQVEANEEEPSEEKPLLHRDSEQAADERISIANQKTNQDVMIAID